MKLCVAAVCTAALTIGSAAAAQGLSPYSAAFQRCISAGAGANRSAACLGAHSASQDGALKGASVRRAKRLAVTQVQFSQADADKAVQAAVEAAKAAADAAGDDQISGMKVNLHPASENKPFDFRGVVAGRPVDTSKLQCAKPKGQVQQCTIRTKSVAGVETSIQSVKLYKGRLDSLEFVFVSSGFQQMRDAFQAKYGDPQSAYQTKFTTRLGEVEPNNVVTWQFKTGSLLLVQFNRGQYAEYSSVWYLDHNAEPLSGKPKVDF